MKKSILILPLLLSTQIALAEEASKAQDNDFKVVGEFAFDYSTYMNDGVATPSLYAAGAHNAFNFSSAQALITKETQKYSLTARINAVKTKFSDGTTTTTKALPALDQFEVFHHVNPALKVGFGRISTVLGLESYMRHENVFYNYSTSFNSLLPAYGEGLRFSWTAMDGLTLIGSTYNEISTVSPWDEKSPTRKATELAAQGSWGQYSYLVGYAGGTNELGTEISFVDAWISYAISEQLTLWLNQDTRTQKTAAGKTSFASSTILQAKYQMDQHGLGFRFESIYGAADPLVNIDGNFTGDYSVISLADRITLSENMSISLELHHQMAKNDDFVDKDGNATKGLSYFTIGGLATF